MADETDPAADKCVACDIIWNTLMVLGVAVIAFIAADVFTQGKATAYVTGLFGKTPLASVLPIRGTEGEQDAS